MKIRIIQIGNSRGIRIPQPLLEQTGLADEVAIRVEENRLVIEPVKPERQPPRKGWSKVFKDMAATGDDRLLDDGASMPARWDKEEWTWE